MALASGRGCCRAKLPASFPVADERRRQGLQKHVAHGQRILDQQDNKFAARPRHGEIARESVVELLGEILMSVWTWGCSSSIVPSVDPESTATISSAPVVRWERSAFSSAGSVAAPFRVGMTTEYFGVTRHRPQGCVAGAHTRCPIRVRPAPPSLPAEPRTRAP